MGHEIFCGNLQFANCELRVIIYAGYAAQISFLQYLSTILLCCCYGGDVMNSDPGGFYHSTNKSGGRSCGTSLPIDMGIAK